VERRKRTGIPSERKNASADSSASLIRKLQIVATRSEKKNHFFINLGKEKIRGPPKSSSLPSPALTGEKVQAKVSNRIVVRVRGLETISIATREKKYGPAGIDKPIQEKADQGKRNDHIWGEKLD